jgi:RNA polymerase sigma-70 factor (ECF subfamily)
LRELVEALTPVVQARVARALMRRRGRGDRHRDVRQEVEDMTQQVFLALFANEGHALRQWDPKRGLTFLNFVGLLAERQVFSALRSRKKNPWVEEPTEDEVLDRKADSGQGPEHMVASREALTAVLRIVRERLSDRGLELFQWLMIEARSAEEVCSITGMTPNAVYAWRSRLGRLVHEVTQEVLSDPGVEKRKPQERAP